MKTEDLQSLALGLINDHPNGLILTDLQWNVEFVNPQAQRLLALEQDIPDTGCLWDSVPELMSHFYKLFMAWARGDGEPRFSGFYPPANRWLRFNIVHSGDYYLLLFEDISREQSREQYFQEVEIYWSRVFDSVVDVILVTDRRGKVERVNSALTKVFGYQADEILGKNISMLMGGVDRSKHETYMHRYRQTGRSAIMGLSRVVKGVHKDGRKLDLELSINVVNSDGDVHYVGVLRDVSERVAQEEQITRLNKDLEQRVAERTRQLQLVNEELERLAMYDSLTGLANRAQFNGIMRTLSRSNLKAGTAYSILMLDLNGFKLINDTLGHHIGDRLLKMVAARINDCMRDGDVVARVGGDEFVILLDKTTGKGAEQAAKKLCKAFEEPFDLDSRYVDCGCSIGIAVFPIHGRVGELVQQHADLAMYHAKRNGLGYSVYSDEIMEEATEAVARINQLR